MKKKLLMVLVFTCILLSGCGKETEQSILKKLKEYKIFFDELRKR